MEWGDRYMDLSRNCKRAYQIRQNEKKKKKLKCKHFHNTPNSVRRADFLK